MKRTSIIVGILILLKLVLPLKPYVELNNLKIVEKIEVNCKKEYQITYIEKIPKKEDNGIEYEKKKYQISSKSLKEGLKEIEKKKHFYIKEAKIEIRNCNNQKEIIETIKRG